MKDFNGGMLVGTKSAYYDAQQAYSPSGSVQYCMDYDVYQVTGIHEPLACMELFGLPCRSCRLAATSVAADTRFAEIWRFDYALKTWSKVLDDPKSQGSGSWKNTAASCMWDPTSVHSSPGSISIAVKPGAWTSLVRSFSCPGRQELQRDPVMQYTACSSAKGLSNPYGLMGVYPNYTGAVNTSIRALASFNGQLYVGTFNATGGQLWAFNEETGAWSFVPIQGVTGNPYKPAIMELRVYNGKLYIGVGGPAGDSYLYSYDGVPGNNAVPSRACLPCQVAIWVSSNCLPAAMACSILEMWT